MCCSVESRSSVFYRYPETPSCAVMFASRSAPGSAVPRPRPGVTRGSGSVTNPTIDLSDSSYPSGGIGNVNKHTPEKFITPQLPPVTGYDDYVHLPTGARALVPVYVCPTGARIQTVPPPTGYVPMHSVSGYHGFLAWMISKALSAVSWVMC